MEKRSQQTTGLLFNIQRFSIHDGPGIRTTVFFKGCPLRCFWCHNPEGLRQKIEIAFYPDRCIGCGDCLHVCPQQAHILKDGQHVYLRDRCIGCSTCIDSCFSGALEQMGRHYSLDEVMEQILADATFYQTSGGGVTLSGGEPLQQARFAKQILIECRHHGIHTALETCGHYPWSRLSPLLPHTDLIMMDLKVLDDAAHKEATGVGNHLILETARRLAETDRPILFRIPLVPTVNDTPAMVRGIKAFVDTLIERRHSIYGGTSAPIDLECLAFHQLATDKYAGLGMHYRGRHLAPLSKSRKQRLDNLIPKKE